MKRISVTIANNIEQASAPLKFKVGDKVYVDAGPREKGKATIIDIASPTKVLVKYTTGKHCSVSLDDLRLLDKENSADQDLLKAIHKEMRQMPAVKAKTIDVTLRKNCICLEYEKIKFYLVQDVSTLNKE